LLEEGVDVNLQFRLLEEIRNLENIENIENINVATFKQVQYVIQELYDSTPLRRKELKFVLNSLEGLIEGFEVFDPTEVLNEVNKLLDRLLDIKEHLTNYTRNTLFKVPDNCSYLDLEPKHFLQLARLQGSSKVLKNLMSIKKQDPNLAPWVDALCSQIEKHKKDLNKKGSFKDQLACLKTIGNLGTQIESTERGTLTLENANFVQKLSKASKQLLTEDARGWASCPVFISCLDKVILRKLKELGYRLKTFAGQYIIISKAQCYGIGRDKASSVQEAIKIMGPLIPKPFIPVGTPVLYETHYYWLCFEFPLAANIKMWNFL
jgi:hypothetical protein